MNSKVARTTAKPEEEEDRLSSLHDSVLCHILSFLPTKYAAITSVLSSRWKSLFLHVSKIDLDDSLVLKRQKKQCRITRSDHEIYDLINFVNRRIMLCETSSSITEFRIGFKYGKLPEAAMINSWLETLLLQNIKVVEIEVRQSPPLFLLSGIFGLKTLSVLKLSGRNIVLRVPEDVCFPNLKVLNLEDLDLQFEYGYLRLSEDQGYPVLEDLSLDRIRFPNKYEVNVEISLPTLKRLAIIGLEYELSRIDIHAPHLQHLVCTYAGIDVPRMQINLHKCESLVSAALSISLLSLAELQSPLLWFLNFFRTINKVKELQLFGGLSQLLCHSSPYLPQFPNLTHLELTATGSLWNLLQRTPNLTSLVCDLGFTIQFFFPLTLGEGASRVVAQNLKEIRMRHFRETPYEIAVVRFLLQKGEVLERMIIERPWYTGLEWSSATRKQLLNLERRSPRCKIELI